MRILILNWRCPKNPRAGGAEDVTYQIARRLVEWGNEVEWFSAAFPSHEELGGVRVVRAGRQWTVHLHAIKRYSRNLGARFDAVIDEVNTIPFFTPIWAKIPSFMFIHQLAREVWWYETPLPLGLLGYAAEPTYLRVYRHTPVFTVSASTEHDLRVLGFRGPITVIPEGVEPFRQPDIDKASQPTFLYVGRMAPSKRVSHVIRAFAEFRGRIGSGLLWLVGDGTEAHKVFLRELASRLGVAEHIEFLGRVSTSEKYFRMTQAHLILMTSVREGWGLAVAEANACGTPAVVYDVPGLRDAVRHQETGLVVRCSPSALADGMVQLIGDETTYHRLADNAKAWSRSFSFERAARMVASELSAVAPN